VAALALLRARWALIVIALLLAALGVQQLRVSRAQADASVARAALAGDRAAYARTAATAEKAARAEESRREAEKQEITRNAQEQIATADAAARDAGRAAAGLRQQVDAFVAAGRRAAAHPSPAVGSPPTTDALDLLADVFWRADDRAGALAAEADRRGIAGAACERAYDSLTTSEAPK
jgi:hypothetical protein